MGVEIDQYSRPVAYHLYKDRIILMEPLNTIEPIGIRESPRIILFTSIIQNGLNKPAEFHYSHRS